MNVKSRMNVRLNKYYATHVFYLVLCAQHVEKIYEMIINILCSSFETQTKRKFPPFSYDPFLQIDG